MESGEGPAGQVSSCSLALSEGLHRWVTGGKVEIQQAQLDLWAEGHAVRPQCPASVREGAQYVRSAQPQVAGRPGAAVTSFHG